MAERQKGYFVGFGFGERRSVLASTRPSKQDVWIALPQAVCAMAGKEGTMASLQMGQRDEDSPTAWGGAVVYVQEETAWCERGAVCGHTLIVAWLRFVIRLFVGLDRCV